MGWILVLLTSFSRTVPSYYKSIRSWCQWKSSGQSHWRPRTCHSHNRGSEAMSVSSISKATNRGYLPCGLIAPVSSARTLPWVSPIALRTQRGGGGIGLGQTAWIGNCKKCSHNGQVRIKYIVKDTNNVRFRSHQGFCLNIDTILGWL